MTNLNPDQFIATTCAVCGTPNNATEIYPANFSADSFNKAVFSARRLPDHIHYRMVKCNTCGLIRSDPIIAADILSQLYQQSEFTYQKEVANLVSTYGYYLQKLQHFSTSQKSFLEIGCGNGFMLQEALQQGYEQVAGVEPSSHAIAQASSEVRPFIVCDMMQHGLFAPQTFDAIALFQVFDHIAQPTQLLEICFELLRPGGLVLLFNHNVNSFSARVLGEKSPIFDVEHTFLYNPDTISRLLAKSGFKVMSVGAAYNNVSIGHLLHLFPMPKRFKFTLKNIISRLNIERLALRLPLGNLYAVAKRTA